MLDTIRPLSRACRKGVILLEEELESNDPDEDEAIGRALGARGERLRFYAVEIPGCRGQRLLVVLDDDQPGRRAVVLGAAPARSARRVAPALAGRWLGIRHDTWEGIP